MQCVYPTTDIFLRIRSTSRDIYGGTKRNRVSSYDISNHKDADAALRMYTQTTTVRRNFSREVQWDKEYVALDSHQKACWDFLALFLFVK